VSSITNLLTGFIQSIYSLINNYGWSIVIFTLLVRVVLMPLDISSRKGMRKMAKIQPQLNALQKKYANDKVKLQQKQSELMRKERYNPLSGCLPLLIQIPILIAMFNAMRAIANEQIVHDVFAFLAGDTPTYEGWLWVKNIWSADSFFASVAPNIDTIKAIPLDVWKAAFENPDLSAYIEQIQAVIPGFGLELFQANSSNLPAFIESTIKPALLSVQVYADQMQMLPGMEQGINLIITTLHVFKQFNGYLILPALAGASQLLMTKVNPQATGQQPAAQNQGQPNMGNFMKYFFPIFSVWITLTSNAGFALYWVVSNLIATAMSYSINLYFDRKDKLAAGHELQEGTIIK
jgi:YidC/Oxa1 family membrane protein insertase